MSNQTTKPSPETPRVSEAPSDLECLLTAVIYESDIVDRQRYMTIAKNFLARQDAITGKLRSPLTAKIRAREIEQEWMNELWNRRSA